MSYCEVLFGGKLDVRGASGNEKSETRQYNDILMQRAEKERKVIEKAFLILKGIKSFSESEKYISSN